jgi:hypothetical protein
MKRTTPQDEVATKERKYSHDTHNGVLIPDILAQVSEYLYGFDVITLTHVCASWRQTLNSANNIWESLYIQHFHPQLVSCSNYLKPHNNGKMWKNAYIRRALLDEKSLITKYISSGITFSEQWAQKLATLSLRLKYKCKIQDCLKNLPADHIFRKYCEDGNFIYVHDAYDSLSFNDDDNEIHIKYLEIVFYAQPLIYTRDRDQVSAHLQHARFDLLDSCIIHRLKFLEYDELFVEWHLMSSENETVTLQCAESISGMQANEILGWDFKTRFSFDAWHDAAILGSKEECLATIIRRENE